MFVALTPKILDDYLLPPCSSYKSSTVEQLLYSVAREGPCANHLIVAYKGKFYKIIPFDDDGEVWSIAKFKSTIQRIEEVTTGTSIPSVGVLTSLPRQEWGQAREHMMAISQKNKEILDEIEKAILFVTLDDSIIEEEESLINLAFAGNEKYRDIFADKTWTRVVTKNGLYASQSEV